MIHYILTMGYDLNVCNTHSTSHGILYVANTQSFELERDPVRIEEVGKTIRFGVSRLS